MAIEISERFQVDAPIDRVWRFVVEPSKVVTCMPGAELVEQLDEKTYVGRVKVRLGAITTSYKGEVVFASVDEASHRMQLAGEGRETGGGTAKGTVEIVLEALSDGGTVMKVAASVDLTGKVMQVGRGMIAGVSKQLFKQFASNAKAQLEVNLEAGEEAAVVPHADTALAVAPLIGKTIWTAIVSFFRRLFGLPERT